MSEGLFDFPALESGGAALPYETSDTSALGDGAPWDAQYLDIGVVFGSDVEWSRTWANDLCCMPAKTILMGDSSYLTMSEGNYSTLGPMQFLDRYIHDENIRRGITDVSTRLREKTVARCNTFGTPVTQSTSRPSDSARRYSRDVTQQCIEGQHDEIP